MTPAKVGALTEGVLVVTVRVAAISIVLLLAPAGASKAQQLWPEYTPLMLIVGVILFFILLALLGHRRQAKSAPINPQT